MHNQDSGEGSTAGLGQLFLVLGLRPLWLINGHAMITFLALEWVHLLFGAWAPNLGPLPSLYSLCGLKCIGPPLVYGIKWAYRDSRLGAHTMGPWFRSWIPIESSPSEPSPFHLARALGFRFFSHGARKSLSPLPCVLLAGSYVIL